MGTDAATPRFTRLITSKVVPKWLQPIHFSEDFNNVLLVAFAPQLADPPAYFARGTNFESKNRMIRGTAIVFYTLAEVILSNISRYLGLILFIFKLLLF